MHGLAQAPRLGAEIPRGAGYIPRWSGEPEGQTTDVQVLHFLPVHQVLLPAGFDLSRVRIHVVRKPQIKASAIPLLVAPVFAIRVVQILRFVFEVVTHVAHDNAASAAARPTAKSQAM